MDEDENDVLVDHWFNVVKQHNKGGGGYQGLQHSKAPPIYSSAASYLEFVVMMPIL